MSGTLETSEALQINADCIHKAAQRIQAHVARTPTLQSDYLNELSGACLYFKCENLQRTGSFKFRGATHALTQLSDAQKQQGVFTVSSGNHGAALAYAGLRQGIPVTVAVPRTAPQVKKNNIARYQATIIEIDPGMAAREAFTEQQMLKGGLFIPPYDHPDIIRGQGTAALELWQSAPHITHYITPLGGGGLLSGTCIFARENGAQRIYGAEPELADDGYRSMQTGKRQPAREPKSICDGLLTSLGEHTFPVLKRDLADILLINDDDTRAAQQLIWQELKIIIEPSCAITLAAILKNPEHFADQHVGVILSGGNVALAREQFA